jgi:restriction system protein
MAELTGVLRAVVAFPIPAVEDLRAFPPEVEPEPVDEDAPRWSDFAPPEPGVFARFGYKRAEAEARGRFEDAYAEFTRRRDKRAEQHRAHTEAARREHERHVDELLAAADRGDESAVPELAAALLATVGPLDDLLGPGRGVYQKDACELTVEIELPGTDVVPAERGWRYAVGQHAVVPVERRRAEQAALYADVVGQVTLAVLTVCFRAFPVGIVGAVTVNGHVAATDPATGRSAHPCLVTVTAARSTFDELRLDSPELDARRCMRFLGAEISPHPFELEEVRPFVDIDLVLRYRLVTAPDALARLDHRTDLMAMHPHEFEKLVAALFRAKGYEAWHTQSSRDDGIDAVARKQDRYIPVECLIQVKRVRSVVPPKDVQALMGAMAEHPTATNGLLVTTSRFSDRTRQRARAQGIATMEGAELGLEIREHLGIDVMNSARTR